jgi:hypothetical protein
MKCTNQTISIETYVHNKDNATICGAFHNCGEDESNRDTCATYYILIEIMNSFDRFCYFILLFQT